MVHAMKLHVIRADWCCQ